MTGIAEIRALLLEKRLVFGREQTAKLLRNGRLAKVFLASNCQPGLLEELSAHSRLAGIECERLSVSSEELGVWCKKPFGISVIGILKSAA